MSQMPFAHEFAVPASADAARPLVVDLDGTLIKTDVLVESFLGLMAKAPLRALLSLGALFKGKAAFKARLADEVSLEMATMPIDEQVRAMVVERRALGASVTLASASDVRYVEQIAASVGLFDDVMGSSDGVNLSGETKAQRLLERYPSGTFDYIGNSTADVPVWRHAGTAILAGGDSRLATRLRREHPDAVVLPHERRGIRPYLAAMRPHQWLKNILVFVPAAAGHALFEQAFPLLLAFLAFSLCASSVYITNDLLDLAGDRDHPRKRLRPFASGAASQTWGALLAASLLVAAFTLAFALPPTFLMTLGTYYVLTIGYSLSLKRQPIVDVIALACLYGLRIVAGGYATGIALSHWLVTLAIFLFLSLALIKRCAELVARQEGGREEIVGRGYRLSDLPTLEAMAAAAGYNSALVLALYIHSEPQRVGYCHEDRLWLLCILLLAWVSRLLLKTRRGDMTDDPIVFAVRDRWSLIIGAASGAVVFMSLC